MYRRAVPDTQKVLEEVERWVAENSSGKERIKYMKKKVESLGGTVKKYFIPFKHGLLLQQHRKKKEAEAPKKKTRRGKARKKK